ncbi:nuclear transport factor 2 family protein [Yokenella regensburgei]|uniref:nuclear transport factor 2 family protein n=1 Tax=Yokenella regensburgei TaxID=158877 RepID=UPI003F175AC7
MTTIGSTTDHYFDFYTALNSQPLAAPPQLGHAGAIFIDPVGEHRGLRASQRYCSLLPVNLDRCRFVIDSPLRNAARFLVSWTMHWSHPRTQYPELRVQLIRETT